MKPSVDRQPPALPRGALVFGWILALSLLTLAFRYWEKNQENPNQQPEIRITEQGQQEVVLQRNRYGHYVSKGFINGKAVTFLLDTGATNVAIPEKMADTLGLAKMARGQASTANGLTNIFYTRIESLVIGNIMLQNIGASINPGMNHDDIILLGMSALKNIEFTQRADQLILRKTYGP